MGRLSPPGIALEGLETLLGAADDLSPLRSALVRLLGPTARLVGSDRFKSRVRRLRVETAGCRSSVIVKKLHPVVACRNRMLAERWLPAVGLEAMGPGLLACAADGGGRHAWQVYEDLGDAALDRAPTDRARVRSAVRAVAELHLRFAGHALLGRCRLYGGDLGMSFYGGNVRDALRALEALVPSAVELPGPTELARQRLMDQLQLLLDDEAERAGMLEEFGGPETLVHGDLWPSNVFVLGSGAQLQVRLIDWDHVGVARFSYDLSTLLMRFPGTQRPEILADYEEALGGRGWQLPDRETLNRLFDTAERARIASHVIWPALALLGGDAEIREWALGTLPEVSGWFAQLSPVLPVDERAVA